MSMIAKNRTKSSWTPLSNGETNNKIFEERFSLLGKWYDKWSDEQRKRILEDLMNRSKIKQLKFVQDIVNEKVPCIREDFTRELPKILSIYIFSFLDPRSLSRCARVSWYWKALSETDSLWMPKCFRFGWFLPFTPSPYEIGVWKRNYIENIKYIHVLRPRDPTLMLENLRLETETKRTKSARTSKDKQKTAPWRGSDPKPKDTWRNNVLENDDYVDSVRKKRERGYYGYEADEMTKNAKSKVKAGTNVLNQARKSQSLSLLSYSEDAMVGQRPQWATMASPYVSFEAKVVDKNKRNASPARNNINATHTFSPIKSGSRPVTARSERDPPTTRLFPEKPWKVPNDLDSDEDI
ncbi:F-box only protein 16-like isoform X1 [Ostrea edulis]|uniref:F-box only protein 16-like isoform X1 n=1 Tax=Ostrea edulis TaxID=37623 RepID=UPI0020954D9A|nr:F-box only protein 16-like isoform X1 [Ostrea edulis]